MTEKRNRKRQLRINIYVTQEELDDIRSKAKAARLSVGEYGRRIMSVHKVSAAPTEEEHLSLRNILFHRLVGIYISCSLMVVSSEDALVSVVCTAEVTDSALCCVLHDAAANTTDANTRSAKILLILIDISS